MLSPHRKAFVYACVAVWLLLVSYQAMSQAPDLETLKAQLAAGDAQSAYRGLAQLEERYAGDPEFDYLLGLAALESGKPDLATFAFERVLTVDPSFFGARLDMARAYFALGNQDLAKAEFEALLKLDPPPAALNTINAYLAAIKDSKRATRARYYVEFGLGYDTNANAATDQNAIAIPNFATVQLDTDSVATEDVFARARVGMDVTHKWDEQTRLRASTSVDHREYLTTDGFETQDFKGGAGIDFIRGEDVYRFDAGLQFVKLDWVEYQLTATLGAQWQRTWNKQTQTTVFAQHSRIRYRQVADKSNDSNLNLVGASVIRALDESGRTLLSASGFVGVDAERNTRIDGSREVLGARLAAQYGLTPDIDTYVSAGVQWSIYDRANTLFQVRRRDTQLDASVGLLWRPAQKWSVRPQLDLRRNLTDVPTNEYERLQVGITVRRDF